MVGYANTQPVYLLEYICNTIVVALGIALYVTIVGTVGSLVKEFDASGTSFENFIDTMKAFMRYRKLPSTLQEKVLHYYMYIWKTRKTLNEQKLLNELPMHLRVEVAIFLNKDILQKVSFFKDLNEQFINSLVLKLIPKLALPGSLIVRKGDIGREMFFLNKGEVEVISEPDENGEVKVFAVLPEGSFFGELSIIFNSKRNASIRAKGYVDFSILLKDDFNNVIETFPTNVKESILEEANKRQMANQK
jgi:hypothetical protein